MGVLTTLGRTVNMKLWAAAPISPVSGIIVAIHSEVTRDQPDIGPVPAIR
jgi:hypothetical protein